MTEHLPAKPRLRWPIAILLILPVLLCLACNYVPLLHSVIRLDVPTPQGSIVRTTVYRTAFYPFGELAWDRHYRIPATTFDSRDEGQQYFDDWLTDNGWERTDSWVNRGYYLPDYCYGARGFTTKEVNSAVSIDYLPRGWNYFEAEKAVCLIIQSEPVEGFYDVRLVTFQPSLFELLND